ncbi:MAG TPA: hypothetical protein VEJ63_22825, partial [Planctomycetota bacterium]|nr:hypothetical protein [Planctomycetota bacterium]
TIVLNKVDLSNAGIRTVADLAGQSFAMDFGGVQLPSRVGKTDTGTQTTSSFASTFDKNGTIRFPNLLTAGAVLPSKTDPRYEISLNPSTGLLKLSFTNIDLIRNIGARFASFNDPVIPISVKIGAPAADAINLAPDADTTTPPATDTVRSGVNFDRTDSIKFLYKRSGSKGRATAGRNDKIPAGGLFLVTKVKGRALRESTLNDRMILNMTGFIRLPGGAPIRPSATDRVQVLLAEKCLGDFPASSLTVRGDIVSFENTDKRAGLRTLIIDNKKGTFTLETFDFNTIELFEQNVLEAGRPFSVPLTLTIANVDTSGIITSTPTFDGQTSITIFRKGNTLVNK